MRTDLFSRSLEEVLLTDFFGGVAQAEVIENLPVTESIQLQGDIDGAEMLESKNFSRSSVSSPRSTTAVSSPDTSRLWVTAALLAAAFAWTAIRS